MLAVMVVSTWLFLFNTIPFKKSEPENVGHQLKETGPIYQVMPTKEARKDESLSVEELKEILQSLFESQAFVLDVNLLKLVKMANSSSPILNKISQSLNKKQNKIAELGSIFSFGVFQKNFDSFYKVGEASFLFY